MHHTGSYSLMSIDMLKYANNFYESSDNNTIFSPG